MNLEDFKREVNKKKSILLTKNQQLTKAGKISDVQLNCRELKGIDYVMEKVDRMLK